MDDATPAVGSTVPLCPWCSAELGSADDTVCPSCGATLTSAAEPQIPGVTTVAPQTSAQLSKPQKRSRLLQWISGEPGDEAAESAPPEGSLAPPSDDVRREIRRLELEAQLTNLSAEASAIAAEEALQARAANDTAGAEAALQVARDARIVSEALEAGTLEATRADGAADASGEAEPSAGEVGEATADTPGEAVDAPPVAVSDATDTGSIADEESTSS